MRIERISENQFSMYVTFSDLIERGLFMNHLGRHRANLKLLFSTMMYEASRHLGFPLKGVLLIQVHFLQAQGMHIFVTQKEQENVNDDYLEMQVTLADCNQLLFAFIDFEHIIQVSSYLSSFSITNGSVYYYDHHYYMMLKKDDLGLQNVEDIVAIMSEYSKPSMISANHLKNNGKIIFEKNAVKQIVKHFIKNIE